MFLFSFYQISIILLSNFLTLLITEEKEKDRQKQLLKEGMDAISFGVRKRERLSNQWFRWKYREEIEVRRNYF